MGKTHNHFVDPQFYYYPLNKGNTMSREERLELFENSFYNDIYNSDLSEPAKKIIIRQLKGAITLETLALHSHQDICNIKDVQEKHAIEINNYLRQQGLELSQTSYESSKEYQEAQAKRRPVLNKYDLEAEKILKKINEPMDYEALLRLIGFRSVTSRMHTLLVLRIDCLEMLSAFSEKDFLCLEGIGKGSVKMIQAKLAEFGMQLSDKPYVESEHYKKRNAEEGKERI